MSQEREAVKAPEFPPALKWLNVDRPLTLRELRGKVVLLDFWTYCCINCMHVIPDLKRLEAKYGDALVVIGVHSAKFTTERETENIRQAILRYEIHHPVVNDWDFQVWNLYGARGWPTFVLIGQDGKIVGAASGEGQYEAFDRAIGELVRAGDQAGTLNRKPIPLRLERDRTPESLLSFPGKVLADAATNRLFIADSNHNRVIVASLPDGTILDVIGGGDAGLLDGTFERARLFRPQGMALDGDTLYIADTENHAIRRADLKRRALDTVAGTGEQARQLNLPGVGMAVALNSPWDLRLHKGALYVAMAGSHQIWRIDLATLRAEPYAGSGRENRTDGPLARAALAQPSGLASDGEKLFVADSEVSAIRTVDLDPGGRVGTVVGEALFEFGDKDGTGAEVRLQHPLGVEFQGGVLWVADTYNNKIKQIDPRGQVSKTFAGTGKSGAKDGPARKATFDEPGGVSAASGKLYVADTNNHAVRVLDLVSESVGTLAPKGLERLAPRVASADAYRGEVVELPEQKVGQGKASVLLSITLPSGYKLNETAPFYAGLRTEDGNVVVVPEASGGKTIPNPSFPLRLPIETSEGRTIVSVDAVIYYCEATNESLCFVKQVRLRVPVRVEAGGPSEVRAAYALTGR